MPRSFRFSNSPYAIELLEPRRMLTADFHLLFDANRAIASTAAAFPDSAQAGSTIYYAASTPSTGYELWATDGTPEGSRLVKDIAPGKFSSTPQHFGVAPDGTLYFMATDGVHGTELWRSDGTNAGTYMVKDISPGTASSSVSAPVFLNGRAYFVCTTTTDGRELWRSDGTDAGTVRVTNLSAGTALSPFGPLDVVNNHIVYVATPPSDTAAYYSTDLNDNTVKLATIVPQTLPGRVVIGSKVFFAAGTNSDQLWQTDGTVAGTSLVLTLPAAGVNPTPFDHLLSTLNGKLLFTTRYYGQLWVSDLTLAGTVQIKNFSTINSSFIDSMFPFKHELYFGAYADNSGQGLWKTDGTSDGTVLVKNIDPGASNLFPTGNFVEYNNSLYFPAFDATHGQELWRTDGTTDGTQFVNDFWPGPGGGTSLLLGVLRNRLVIAANGQLVSGDGTAGNWQPLSPWSGITKNIVMTGSLVFGDRLIFGSVAGGNIDIWSTDGTDLGTVLLNREIAGVETSGLPIARLGDSFVFVNGSKLYRSDGTPAGTTFITTLSNTSQMTSVGDRVYFSASDTTHGRELWQTDGTLAGTFMVKDLTPGTGNTSLSNLTGVGNKLFFTSNYGGIGTELYVLTAGQTDPIGADLKPGTGSSSPTGLVACGNSLFFIAIPSTSIQIFETDGDQIKSVGGGYSIGTTTTFVRGANGVYFSGRPAGSANQVLWFIPATPGQGDVFTAVQLTGVSDPNTGTLPNNITAVGNLVYFAAASTLSGRELWRTDGTVAGTQQVVDLDPGAGDSILKFFAEDNGKLAFYGSDQVGRAGIWTSDGTAAGTTLIVPSTVDQPNDFQATPIEVGQSLFSLSTSDWAGIELFMLRDPDDIAPEVAIAEVSPEWAPSVSLQFSEAIQNTLSADSFSVIDLNSGQPVPISRVTQNIGTKSVIVTLPNGAGRGQYRLTLRASDVTDLAGNSMPADYTFDFAMLPGDADHNGVVDILDFNILAANFGLSGKTTSEGNYDFSPDGTISITDFNILAANFGDRLSAPANPLKLGTTSITAVTPASAMRSIFADDSNLLSEAGLL